VASIRPENYSPKEIGIIRESADPEHLISANGFCLFAINLYKDDIKLIFLVEKTSDVRHLN
jgi:hypothetical protein